MSDNLIARLEAWDITDDDKAAIAAELTRLRARVEAADKLARALDEVSLSDLEDRDFRKVFAALSAYEEAAK